MPRKQGHQFNLYSFYIVSKHDIETKAFPSEGTIFKMFKYKKSAVNWLLRNQEEYGDHVIVEDHLGVGYSVFDVIAIARNSTQLEYSSANDVHMRHGDERAHA